MYLLHQHAQPAIDGIKYKYLVLYQKNHPLGRYMVAAKDRRPQRHSRPKGRQSILRYCYCRHSRLHRHHQRMEPSLRYRFQGSDEHDARVVLRQVRRGSASNRDHRYERTPIPTPPTRTANPPTTPNGSGTRHSRPRCLVHPVGRALRCPSSSGEQGSVAGHGCRWSR